MDSIGYSVEELGQLIFDYYVASYSDALLRKMLDDARKRGADGCWRREHIEEELQRRKEMTNG